ncbi:hypothetical protein FA95DRAFT_1602026 [Auriscalpium vulgare]|uniref:Uncharacterized protein n=1 Tax=Auriscalpium vulgare TaxID=40419 RepID=A0ACB8S931_9AGAM|nr:hypothetical protein FA95DRAFT_1602026 [Auriscalpium vulgare]
MFLQRESSLSSLHLFDLSSNAESPSSSAEKYIENSFLELLAMADEYEQSKRSSSAEPATHDQSSTMPGNNTTASTSSPPADLALPPEMLLIESPKAPSHKVKTPPHGHSPSPSPSPSSSSCSPTRDNTPRAHSHSSSSPTDSASPLSLPRPYDSSPGTTPTASSSRASATPNNTSREPSPHPLLQQFLAAQPRYDLETAALEQAIRIQEHLETLREMGFHADVAPVPMPHIGVPSVAYAIALRHQERLMLMGTDEPPTRTQIPCRYEAPRQATPAPAPTPAPATATESAQDPSLLIVPDGHIPCLYEAPRQATPAPAPTPAPATATESAQDPSLLIVRDEHEWIPMRGRARPGTAKRSRPQNKKPKPSAKKRRTG